jgi:hypothetical protein
VLERADSIIKMGGGSPKKSGGGGIKACLGSCAAILCCCFLCDEGVDACADCAGMFAHFDML